MTGKSVFTRDELDSLLGLNNKDIDLNGRSKDVVRMCCCATIDRQAHEVGSFIAQNPSYISSFRQEPTTIFKYIDFLDAAEPANFIEYIRVNKLNPLEDVFGFKDWTDRFLEIDYNDGLTLEDAMHSRKDALRSRAVEYIIKAVKSKESAELHIPVRADDSLRIKATNKNFADLVDYVSPEEFKNRSKCVSAYLSKLVSDMVIDKNDINFSFGDSREDANKMLISWCCNYYTDELVFEDEKKDSCNPTYRAFRAWQKEQLEKYIPHDILAV